MTGPYRCPSDHAHAATFTCYKTHGCRCGDCRVKNTAAVTEWRRQRDAGENTPTVTAARARRHILKLRAGGMNYQTIADRAGVGYSVVQHVGSGKRRRITQLSEDCILAVTLRVPTPTPGKPVDSTGVRRRLQALTWMGWTGEQLMTRIGKRSEESTRIITSRLVVADTRDAVYAMYDELWDKHPPVSYGSQRAALRARRYGWVGPLAWDDDTIDDPNARPVVADEGDGVDTLAVELAVHGDRPKLTQAERHLVVPRLHALRWSDGKIGAWIGVSSKTVGRDRVELGLAAWDQNDLEDERKAA